MLASILLALIAAICFSIAPHSQKSGLAYSDDLVGTFVSVATMAVIFTILALPTLEWAFWTSEALVYFVFVGFLFPALGQRFMVLGVKAVGPALSTAVSALMPLFACVVAVVFLGETVGVLQSVGIALLIAGGVLAAFGRGINWRNPAFYLLLLPLAAALVRAIAHPGSKAGYNILPEPVFGAMIMTGVSTLILGSMLLVSRKPRQILPLNRGHKLFAINGVVMAVGILALQWSLIFGNVTYSASLASTSPLWTLALGIFFFKNETLKWWHGLVAMLVTMGGVLVAVG